MIEIAFKRTTTKVGTMELVDPAYSTLDILDGVARGTFVIAFGGKNWWGSVCCRDSDHVVAHIFEANDDAGGAEYGNLVMLERQEHDNAEQLPGDGERSP